MKKRTYIILALCLLIIALCVGLFFFLRKRSSSESDSTLEVTPVNNAGVASDPVLKRGSRGEDVKKLQRYLHGQLILAPIYSKEWPMVNGNVLSELAVDGIFGEKTECACQWWFGRTSIKTSEIPESL